MNDLILNCYTDNDKAILYPPCHMREVLPKWWKDLLPSVLKPSPYGDMLQPTMKGCDGFKNFFSCGIALRLHTDIEFTINETSEFGVSISDTSFDIEIHPEFQRGDYMPNEKYQHLKLVIPWFLETKDKINFLYTFNSWCLSSDSENFIIPSGIVNFKSQNSLHINMFLPYTGYKKIFTLKAGLPIMSLFPLTEKTVTLQSSLILSNDIISRRKSSLHDKILTKKLKNNIKKSIELKNKCPFAN